MTLIFTSEELDVIRKWYIIVHTLPKDEYYCDNELCKTIARKIKAELTEKGDKIKTINEPIKTANSDNKFEAWDEQPPPCKDFKKGFFHNGCVHWEKCRNYRTISCRITAYNGNY